jgi:hypothetical protein
MILSVGFVVGLFGWCIYRVSTSRGPVDSLHGLDGIDTRDTDEG